MVAKGLGCKERYDRKGSGRAAIVVIFQLNRPEFNNYQPQKVIGEHPSVLWVDDKTGRGLKD